MSSKYMLTHGGFVSVNDDELMHWKYVKKKRVNGKWRYYYDDSEYKNAKKEHDQAKLDHEVAKGVTEYTKNNFEEQKADAEKDGKVTGLEKMLVSISYDAFEIASSTQAATGKRFVETQTKYKKALKKDKLVRPIAKGIATIGNLFRKIIGS